MPSMDFGIDLGTATVIIYDNQEGLLLKEPSVVAINKYTDEVIAVGAEAYQMLGRTPDRIQAIRPLRSGVISDYQVTEMMIKYFLNKLCANKVLKPRICICVPSAITPVESNAVVDAAVSAGARKVFLIEEPVAAAIGAGIDITLPVGSIILDIGGGTSDIAVLSLGGIVCKVSIRVAGDKFDEAIIRYIRSKYNVLIGEKTAEKLKIQIGSVYDTNEPAEADVKGRNLYSGIPQKIRITRSELIPILQEVAIQIVAALRTVLEKTPPELMADIQSNGLVMTGGGCLIHGLSELIQENTLLNVIIAEDPVECVAKGTGKAFEYMGKLIDGFINPSTHTH